MNEILENMTEKGAKFCQFMKIILLLRCGRMYVTSKFHIQGYFITQNITTILRVICRPTFSLSVFRTGNFYICNITTSLKRKYEPHTFVFVVLIIFIFISNYDVRRISTYPVIVSWCYSAEATRKLCVNLKFHLY